MLGDLRERPERECLEMPIVLNDMKVLNVEERFHFCKQLVVGPEREEPCWDVPIRR